MSQIASVEDQTQAMHDWIQNKLSELSTVGLSYALSCG
jgi:hypothetical protein